MQQFVSKKTARVRQKHVPEYNSKAVNRAEESGIVRHDYNSIGNVSCRIGDNACAAKHVSVIHRTGLLHPINESRKIQSVLRLQRQYGNRFVQRVIAQHAIQQN